MAHVPKMDPVADSSISTENTLDWTQVFDYLTPDGISVRSLVCGFMQSGWVGTS